LFFRHSRAGGERGTREAPERGAIGVRGRAWRRNIVKSFWYCKARGKELGREVVKSFVERW
jgi:hypothetical protein